MSAPVCVGQITDHLSWLEVARDDADRLAWLEAHPEVHPDVRRVCKVAEALRAKLGGKPIRVTSGIRPPKAGARIVSQHEAGQALDLQFDGLTPLHVLGVLREMAAAGELPYEIRQVIAETLRGESALHQPMGPGSGQWVHIAVIGSAGRPYSTPAGSKWLVSYDPPNGGRVYRAAP